VGESNVESGSGGGGAPGRELASVAADTTITVPAPDSAPPPGAFDDGWAERGRYALVGELARGGGGRIAVAVDRKLGRRVAMKRPLDVGGGARLEREALVLARLEHPSIVPIHDAGRDREGAPYYTMKLVDGETLAARLARAASFTERLSLLTAVISIADAMAYAHTQGVIHRDLKPSNVVIGAFGEVAVIDWGLGKLVDEADGAAQGGGAMTWELTGHDSVVGTPAYMAPEQARGEPVDRRTDVYALGALLYQVLSGETPYGRAEPAGTLAQLAAGPPPAVDVREPRVPRDLAAIVGKAMARSPAARYASATELADDLRRYQTGRLVAAHRYGPWTRARRWLRRHQVRVVTGAGALVVAVAVATVVWARAGNGPDELCRGVDAPVREVWNPAIAGRIQAAFLASGAPAAAASWRSTTAELDRRSARIAEMRSAACRATRITGEQSLATLDLRMTCLDRRTDELRSLVAWLSRSEPATVRTAAERAATLSRIDDCGDVARLRDVIPLPADPVLREVIASVEREVDAAMIAGRDGKFAEIDRAFPAILARAEATGYEPLRAHALYERAQLLILQTRTAELTALIDQALGSAERAGADRLRADILRLRLHVELNTFQHVDVAAALAAQILAIGERVGDPGIQSSALSYLAQIESRRDHPDAAVRAAERAVALIAEPDGRDGWSANARLATVYGETHRPADAKRIFERVIASRRAVIGDADDPNLAGNLLNLAAIHHQLDDTAGALALAQQGVAMYDRILPADARPRLAAHISLSVLQSELGHHTAARKDLVALLPIAEGKLGHDHATVAELVFRIAEAREREADARHLDDALAGYRDALASYTAATVPVWVAKSHGHIGSVLLVLGRYREARVELEAALAAMIATRGEDSPEAAFWRGDLGRAVFRLGELRPAIALLERAIAGLDKGGEDQVERGLYRAYLAMAHWQLGERPAALDRAREARALLVAAGVEGKDGLDELTTWERTRK